MLKVKFDFSCFFLFFIRYVQARKKANNADISFGHNLLERNENAVSLNLDTKALVEFVQSRRKPDIYRKLFFSFSCSSKFKVCAQYFVQFDVPADTAIRGVL